MLEFVRVAGADPAMLELEFTESAIARNGTLVVRQLQALRDAGITIAIDDFGVATAIFPTFRSSQPRS